MAWVGRNRGNGDRYPSGKLRPKPKPAPPPPQPHREGLGDDPKASTVHGRYRLRKLISEPQWRAGERFGRDRARYRAAIGAPDSLRTRHEGLERDDQTDDEIVRHFEGIRDALGRLYVDVEFIVCRDAMLSDLTHYRAALDRLVAIYGIKQED